MNDLTFQEKLRMFGRFTTTPTTAPEQSDAKEEKIQNRITISERISTITKIIESKAIKDHNTIIDIKDIEAKKEIKEESKEEEKTEEKEDNKEFIKEEQVMITDNKKEENVNSIVNTTDTIPTNPKEELKNENIISTSTQPEPKPKPKPNPQDEYLKIIQNNPEELFKDITPERVKNWKDILYVNIIDEKLKDDSEILNTINNHENQRVIKNDVARTRVRESVLLPSFSEYLEFFITYYCKQNRIKYKQGLNEIIGIMILLKYKIKITLSEIFNLIQAFVSKFLTNYYREEKLFALNSSLSLLTLLLKYHIPLIYNVLDYAMIVPQMYGTNWIMTMFANKFRLDIMYHLWDHLININDSLFMHFIIVAFLQYNSNKITGSDISQIPSIMTHLSIDSTEDLDNIIQLALDIRNKTPYSFRILCNNLQIFTPNSTELEKCFKAYKPDTMTALPMYPSEIFYITYRGEVNCPDDQCENYSDNLFSLMNKPTYHTCEHCEMKIYKQINYIFFDLRILEYGSFETSDEKTGFLPMMIMVEQEMLKRDEFAKETAERFVNDKGNYHFVFMTSKTDYFTDYEDNFYEEKNGEIDKYLMMCAIQTKVDKELNTQKVNELTQKEKFKLKEYDNLKKLLVALLKYNYPYVSFVYGGFHAVHDLSIKYEISLLNHDPSCDICKQNRKKDTRSTFFGFLDQSRKKTVHKKAKQITEEKKEEKPQFDNTPIEGFIKGNKKKEPRQSITGLSDKIKIFQITKMLQDTDFSVNICTLQEYKKKIYNMKTGNQIMLIMDQEDLYIFKVEKPKNTDPNEEEKFGAGIDMESDLTKLDVIKIRNIREVTPKKGKKNIVTITYIEYKNTFFSKKVKEVTELIRLDFINDNDSKKFIFTLNQYKKIPKENELITLDNQ